mgnify:CR=1 FL=1
MPVRRWHKLAMLHKLETVYGTDAAPAATNAIVATNITFTPLQAEEVERDLMLPYFGNQGKLLTAEHGRIEFDVEIAGSGVKGTVPKYGSLLRACGMSETVTAATAVDYQIIEDGIESGSVRFNADGVQHIFLGAQANVTINVSPKAIPKYRFSLVGLLGSVTDTVLPAVTMTGWIPPVIVNKANTVLTLHGWTAVAESVSLDLGNVLTPRFLIGDERVLVSDRKSTGTIVVEARSLAEINWFQRAQARTRGALSLIHGTADGNIVEITAPAVEIGVPSQGQTDGLINYSLPLSLCPVSGRDELKIKVR